MNPALDLILSRQSTAQLAAPAPNDQQLDTLLKAASLAPDHARLAPWQFKVYAGEGLKRLGELFAQAKQQEQPDIDEELLEKARQLPMRAPMVILASTKAVEHPKVPEIEQVITTGCAVHGMLYAAQALGLGGYWRTGALAYSGTLKQLIGLNAKDHIVGFLYLGTPINQGKPAKRIEINDHVSYG